MTEKDLVRHRRTQRENYFKIRFTYPDRCSTTIETLRHQDPKAFLKHLQEVVDELRDGLEPGRHGKGEST